MTKETKILKFSIIFSSSNNISVYIPLFYLLLPLSYHYIITVEPLAHNAANKAPSSHEVSKEFNIKQSLYSQNVSASYRLGK